MYFPLILAALVTVSAVFLLRQFWTRSLDDDDAHMTEDILPAHDDASHDALKAA